MLGRFLKLACLITMVLGIAGTVALIPGPDVYSGGGTDYTVTVSNPTESECRAAVLVNKMVDVPLETVKIQPGSSYTWHCGAYCPTGLKGFYMDRVHWEWRKMICTNMLGQKYDCNTGLGAVASCKSAKFKVCRKAGEDDVEVRDYDFGFCKE